jgi:rhodanese-related sulfurtransferase
VEVVSRAELERGVAEGGALFDVRPVPKPVFGLTPERLDLAAVQRGELPELTKDMPLYLVCERGQVSELAGLYLEAAGFTRVFHLAGGLRAWPD